MATIIISVDMVLLESMVVVVGAAVLAGAGSVVVVAVAVTCCMSATGSAGCDGGIVSVSCSFSEACNFVIVFCQLELICVELFVGLVVAFLIATMLWSIWTVF